MKNFCISLICLSIIILTIVLCSPAPAVNEEYLRIHIRANSNSAEDQAVKYAVRDEVVNYLTPVVAECDSKEALENALKAHFGEIERLSETVLEAHGKYYGSKARLTAEEFPTRVYGDLTLENGYYDAVIINLGEGNGDNWWCVVYPPLCFTGTKGENGFRYKSRILEIVENWRKRNAK